MPLPASRAGLLQAGQVIHRGLWGPGACPGQDLAAL
jgi:hypothetical protein